MSKKKVLVVDDEKELVEVAQVLLESNGFDVAAAYTGEDGKTAALVEKPDVIILGAMLETFGAGFDVARWLRGQGSTRTVPIIMLTAFNQNVPWRFASDEVWLPVDVFLNKPVSPEKLLRGVKKLTGSK